MATNQSEKRIFPVSGMHCVSCAGRVEKTLSSQSGVKMASINFAAANVTVEYNTSLTSPEALRKAVVDAGYEMTIEEDKEEGTSLEEIASARYDELKRRALASAVLTIPIVLIAMIFMDLTYGNLIMAILSTPVVFYFGRGFFVNAWKQIRHRSVTMDTLVALSTGIAYLFSMFNLLFPEFWRSRGVEPHVYFEAASVIITFILIGRLLEEKAKGNTTSAIRKLIGLQPRTAAVADKQGKLRMIPIDQIVVGSVIMVRSGEKIPVDGTVTEGSSFVDESMLSGEPIPELKEKGSKVFAGTINQKGSFRFTADKVGKETLLAQIIRMVQEAQGSKAPVQKTVDKIASVFVPVVMNIALLSFLLWVLLDPVNGVSHGVLSLVTVLIIACPCALGLATPTAIMVGMGKGAEHGILIKDAESLEIARSVDVVVLDKTGTITEGKPAVSDAIWYEDELRYAPILLNLEKHSEHPLAEAVTSYLDNGLPESAMNQFESITGKGVRGEYEGVVYWAGSRRLISENGIEISKEVDEAARLMSKEGKSVVWFAHSNGVLALFAVADRIKESSVNAVEQLKSYGIKIYMLTGDNRESATSIAIQAGIHHFEAEVLPQDKAGFVKQLQEKGHKVAMVGDGINDSAALAQADLSIAMGKGSDIAMDVARITIVSSDLTKIVEAMKLSRKTVRTIRQNLFWAFIYNLISIPLAAGLLFPFTGFLLNPMIAGAAMALSSISVVTNSLRLRYGKM